MNAKFIYFTKDYINKYWFQFGILLLIIYFLPYIFLGDNSFILIWDYLDSGVSSMKIAVETGWDLDRNITVNNVMNGLSIGLFPSKINFIFLLFYLFPPFIACIVNDFIIRVIAFIGIFLLLNKYILSKNNIVLTFTISLMFAVIPFSANYGLSVPGQPLLFYALLNLLNNENNWKYFAFIILFGLYSSFIIAGLFIIIFACLILLIHTIYTKKFNLVYLLGVALLSITYLISEFQLISFTLSDAYFVPQRNAVIVPDPSYDKIINDLLFSLKLITKTQDHYGSIYTSVILCSLIFSLFITLREVNELSDSARSSSYKIRIPKIIPWKIKIVIVLISSIIFFHVISAPIILFFHNYVPVIKTFQFYRFTCLLPPLWIILFALSLDVLAKKKLLMFVCSLIILQFLTITFDVMSRDYVKNIVYMVSSYKTKASVSFKQFFDVELFTKIDHYINRAKEDYRIVSLGLYPSVTQYNGFYTLDSYQTLYPLEYKKQFRRIMEKELTKSDRWKNYFDSWGSRCYLFSSELDWFAIGKHEMIEINNLEINTDVIKEMGGQYIFSAVKIINNVENNLVLEKIFETDTSWWRIYLYRII